MSTIFSETPTVEFNVTITHPELYTKGPNEVFEKSSTKDSKDDNTYLVMNENNFIFVFLNEEGKVIHRKFFNKDISQFKDNPNNESRFRRFDLHVPKDATEIVGLSLFPYRLNIIVEEGSKLAVFPIMPRFHHLDIIFSNLEITKSLEGRQYLRDNFLKVRF